MIKKEFVDRFKQQLIASSSEWPVSLTSKQVEVWCQAIVGVMISSLMNDERIEIRGVGCFNVKPRAPRVTKNPKTKAVIHVAAQKVLTFKPGKDLLDRLNGGSSS